MGRIDLPDVWRDEDEPDFFSRDPEPAPDPLPSGDPDWPTCPEHGITHHVFFKCLLCVMDSDPELAEDFKSPVHPDNLDKLNDVAERIMAKVREL